MTNILKTILAAKRDEVIAAKAARAFSDVDAAARACGPVRGMRAALTRPPGGEVRVLAEIKRASPSAGPIRPGANAAAIADQSGANRRRQWRALGFWLDRKLMQPEWGAGHGKKSTSFRHRWSVGQPRIRPIIE